MKTTVDLALMGDMDPAVIKHVQQSAKIKGATKTMGFVLMGVKSDSGETSVKKKCSRNCLEGLCFKSNGTCYQGCHGNFTGYKCLCPSKCECDLDGTCKKCSNESRFTCDKPCSAACIGNICSIDTELKCFYGCREGEKDSLCSQDKNSKNSDGTSSVIIMVIPLVIVTVVLGVVASLIICSIRKRRAQNDSRSTQAESKNLLQESSDKKIDSGSEDASSNQLTDLHTRNQNAKTSIDFESVAETELVSSHTEPVVGKTEVPGDQRKADRVKTKQSNKDQQYVEQKISKPVKIVQLMVGKPKTSGAADRGKSESRQQKIKDIAELLKTKDEVVIRKEFSVLPSVNNDFNKVVVIGHDRKQHYINASYIQVKQQYVKIKALTALVGELKDSLRTNRFRDKPEFTTPTNEYYGWDFLFWRMVWQNRSSVIVMLNKLDENNTKLEQYWPNKNKTENYGFLCVTCLWEYAKDTLSFVRTFEIKGENTEPIVVKQLQYLGWSEGDAEENFRNLLEFRNIVNTAKQTNSGPTVVHSRKDTGRTGTYIALDLLLQSLDDMDDTVDGTALDIYSCVKHLRVQRARMVATVEQYKFLYNVLAYYLHSKAENEEDRDANKLSLKKKFA